MREEEIVAEKIFKEIIAENCLYLVKDIHLQIQEMLKTPNKVNLKKTMPRHIIIIILKNKDLYKS